MGQSGTTESYRLSLEARAGAFLPLANLRGSFNQLTKLTASDGGATDQLATRLRLAATQLWQRRPTAVKSVASAVENRVQPFCQADGVWLPLIGLRKNFGRSL
jgi:hypothetical protein